MLDPISIAIIIFVLFAWSRALLRFKEGGIGLKEFVVWSIIWMLVLGATLFRGRLGFIARFTTQRPLDVILVGSIILLFYLLFRIYVKIDSMDQNTTKIVRELALEKKRKR